MSWLSDIADGVGSIFGGGGGVVPSSNGGGGSIWPSLIEAGTGLAGIWANSNTAANQLEAYNKNAQLQYELAKQGGGGGSEAAKLEAMKRQTLAQLYSNYAQSVGEGAAGLGRTAMESAQIVGSPIVSGVRALYGR